MERFHAPDTIRGIAVISMILYHAAWDIQNVMGVYMPWFDSAAAYVWQQSICWTFILLSGFCRAMGKQNLKRGLTVFAAGLLVTAATALVTPGDIIICGVLTLIGSCMLIMIPLDKPFGKIPPLLGFILAAALFFVFRNVNNGNLGFEGFVIAYLPHEALYKNTFTAFLGFPPYTFFSSDYFSLLPWLWLFIAGYFLRGVFEKYGMTRFLRLGRARPIEFVGRHALIIYLLHQPLLYAAFSLMG